MEYLVRDVKYEQKHGQRYRVGKYKHIIADTPMQAMRQQHKEDARYVYEYITLAPGEAAKKK